MSGETKEKTLIELAPSAGEKIEVVTKTTNTTLAWVEKIHKLITKNGLKKLVFELLVVGMVVFMGLFLFQPGIFVNRFEEYKEARHAERMEKRTNNTPLIQAELDKLRTQTNASWASVWELHNSTNNLEGLPFMFASLTYESMGPAIMPIAEQFDNVRLSLYPLATYLRQNEMWCGTVDELEEIDRTAYYRAKALNIKYLGFKLMNFENTPNAVLSMAFVDGSDVPTKEELAQACVFTSYKINSLLSLDDETSKKKK